MVKKIIVIFLLASLLSEICIAEGFSGTCVYPGSFMQVDLSRVSGMSGGDVVRLFPKYSIVEMYGTNDPQEEPLERVIGGGVYLSSLKFLKVGAISGPYFEVLLEVYDKWGNKVADVSSGKICNLGWLRQKYGALDKQLLEKETPPSVFGVVKNGGLSGMARAVICISCLLLGLFMGASSKEMIKYLGEENS